MGSARPPQDDPQRRREEPSGRAEDRAKPGLNNARNQTPGEAAPPGRSYQPLNPGRQSGPPPPPRPDNLFNEPNPARPGRRQRSRPVQKLSQNEPYSPGLPPPPGRSAPPQRPRPAPVRRPDEARLPGERPLPRRKVQVQLGPIFGYAFLITLVVAGLVGLFVATRLFNFLGGISVERQDTSGNVVAGSNVTGHGRVNIALLGLDRRPNDSEGTRSDSMLIISVDQDNKTANLMSIPRDLWLKVPGHGQNRINTAYFFGDQERPGKGGPPLVKQTIAENLGIQIDYFAEIDFGGFRAVVDALGGITIDVKKPLVDNEYPTEDYGIKRIYIPAGIQKMDGQVALEYARSRHADSDLGRNQRQQEVLLAVREQGIGLGLLTNNGLQTALQGAIKTDLTPGDMLALGQIAVGMKRESIRQFSIDANITRQALINGNDVLVIDKAESLQTLVRNFLAPAPAATGPTNSTNNTAPAREEAKISVLNGTFQEGRAARTQKFLESKGYPVASIDQASDAGKYPNTIINIYTGKQRTAAEIAGLLGVSADRIKAKTGGPTGIDVEVICGDDLKLPE